MAIKFRDLDLCQKCCICNKPIRGIELKLGSYLSHPSCAKFYKIKNEDDIYDFFRKREYKEKINDYVVDFIKNKKFVNLRDIFYKFNKIHNIPELKRAFFKITRKILLENRYEKRSPAVTCTAYMKID